MSILKAGNKRSRLILDVPAEIRRRIRLAAAYKDVTSRDYILKAINKQLEEEPLLEEESLVLSSKTDQVLSELWNNSKDAQYDRL